jgi:SWI/SNF-related matrix-associated actin-dependent regulator 1 of chromatin subfamily A
MRVTKKIQAYEILKNYNGTNDFIKKLSQKKDIELNNSQIDFIVKFYKNKPLILNKEIEVHPFVSFKLKEKYNLNYEPKTIFIEKVFGFDREKVYIWGRLERGTYNSLIPLTVNATINENDVPTIQWNRFKRKPYEHQKDSVEFLMKHDKAILADDMGLGKTGSSIMAALKRGFKKILVVCPASLKLNWKKEIKILDPKGKTSVIYSSNWKATKWTIINYDILKNFHHKPQRGVKKEDLPISPIDNEEFDLIIIDEAHYLKSADTTRSKLVMDFIEDIKVRWLLTGTPITNKPIDYFNLLKMISHPIADNWVYFIKRYCNGKQRTKRGGGKYWYIGGASNLDELHNFTKSSILRRLRHEAIDLPEKQILPVYLNNDNAQTYNEHMEEYKEWIRSELKEGNEPHITQHLSHLVAIRQLLANDKVKTTIELAEKAIENGKKVVIFTCFTETLRSFLKHFGEKKSVYIDGSVSAKGRQKAVDDFQKKKNIKVFVGNIIAAGVGITLTEAEVMVFNDLDWVPANHAQAEDRIMRIGQKRNVLIYYPLIDETFDVDMFHKLAQKKKIINKILGEDDNSLKETLAKYLVQKMYKDL